MASDHRSQAAISLLSRMLFGISQTAQMEPGKPEESPDYALATIETEDTTVSTRLHLPSGDVFKISVSWDAKESP